MKRLPMVTAVTVALLVSVAISLASESGAALYNHANALYGEHKYDEAIALYEQAAASGVIDARLEYNLGNAYLKKTPPDVGRAILHYERARLLDPRDPDLLYNLNYANNLITEKPPVAEMSFLQTGWHMLMRRISTVEAVTAFTIVYLFLTLLMVIRILARTRRAASIAGRLIVIAAVLLVLDLPVFVGKLKYDARPRAVVIATSVSVHSGPGESNPELFKMPAGTVVRLGEKRGEWRQATVPGGMSGWAPVESIEPIEP